MKKSPSGQAAEVNAAPGQEGLFDHMFDHRQRRSTRKQWNKEWQRVSESLRQVLFAKRVPVKQEVKPPVAVWLEQTVR